ncbi:unnamed protein product [Durusdinium trenchii]|uniref:Uncharacterized protein n=1 Tax=Durusdinium trenchii TaxID=1381693 RepID=A0ABP0PSX1_9DINO
MGAGGSIPISPAGGKIVEPSEEEIKEMAKNIPPEMLEVLKKVVAAKEAGGGPPASSGKMWTPIKSLGNSKEATDMKRAMFMWDEETAKEALGQLFEGKKEMPQMNGATLVMEEVKWANEEEAKKFGNALKSCATAWMWEQKDADVPFDPTTSVEKKEESEWLRCSPSGRMERSLPTERTRRCC